LEGQEVCYITCCCHIFCEECATRQFNKERICPNCDTPLTQRGGISRNILAPSPDKIIQLCGLNPKDIISMAGKAIDFWNYQFQTALEYERSELRQAQNKVAQIEKVYNEKLEDNHNKIATLRKQLEASRKEAENDKKEITELQEKYSEKSRQKRKLEELYDSLKQRYEGGYSRSNTGYLALGYQDGPSDPIPLQRDRTMSPLGMLSRRTNSPQASILHDNPPSPDVDRFSFAKRKAPVRLTNPAQKPDRPVMNLNISAPSPVQRPLFRPLKIPESPRFSTFPNR